MNIVMLAGRILLESGAEAKRVEDTMQRIAMSYGYEETQGYALNIFINFSLSPDHDTRMVKIQKSDTNLRKVFLVNHISRQIAQQKLSFDEAYQTLKSIDNTQHRYDLWHKMLFAGLISMGFLYLQGGSWQDLLPAVLAGAFGYFVTEYMKGKQLTLFIPDFLGAIVIGLVAIPINHWIGSPNLGATITAGVMPIVPGVLITTAIQDLFERHMLMFTAKFLEAIVTSFAIGAGITTAFLLL
ncbi:threonine/serine exporter family protein [Staphylococcus americanisciuri]|uniref:Threonine/serine exporter family protein n=1 Tax=Staphylococcus americanisciuri TaxID=2973940 RepID=A0ABT2F254_9STAP|nr:threonine/serine exporter family protein [Staphylococcus americanisciuri]MCS4486526.1 threonine/serine exporter family protein [Staphylococcus americanisciuri]